MKTARTIQLGKYTMEIVVESDHYEKKGDAWEGTVAQSDAWYSVEYKLAMNGRILTGTMYFGADALKLMKGVPAGACGLIEMEENGKQIPLYLTADNASLVEQTVIELKAEAADPEIDRIIAEKQNLDTAEQLRHYQLVKDSGDAEIASKGHLMTRAEGKAMQRRWNKVENEGADGYVPRFIAKEDYEEAIEWLLNN